jgi:hypothetical protein
VRMFATRATNKVLHILQKRMLVNVTKAANLGRQ